MWSISSSLYITFYWLNLCYHSSLSWLHWTADSNCSYHIKHIKKSLEELSSVPLSVLEEIIQFITASKQKQCISWHNIAKIMNLDLFYFTHIIQNIRCRILSCISLKTKQLWFDFCSKNCTNITSVIYWSS